MGDIGALYEEGRQRITELVRDLDDEAAATTVPTCPEWSVKDVVSHLAGVCDDVLTGNIAGVATDPWTEAQVVKRRDLPLAEILAEWAEKAPQVEAIAGHFPGRVGTQWVLDVTTHEHDVRVALRAPGARDVEAIDVALGFMLTGFAVAIDGHGLPPLEVRAGDRSWVLGSGTGQDGNVNERLAAVLMGGDPPIDVAEPAVTAEASAFEWVRALTGRRSLDQVRAFKWSGDSEPYFPAFAFGPFRPSPVDIEE
ncbi:MAG TPA: maleylpyruvate isomerase family mycothiol-dependent enzyme [Acidimicrobiales bacterium]|nr:maleylpyruvate isomerase family mycothiol-dependent enzyme [Acidimicrobiales bacterium]